MKSMYMVKSGWTLTLINGSSFEVQGIAAAAVNYKAVNSAQGLYRIEVSGLASAAGISRFKYLCGQKMAARTILYGMMQNSPEVYGMPMWIYEITVMTADYIMRMFMRPIIGAYSLW